MRILVSFLLLLVGNVDNVDSLQTPAVGRRDALRALISGTVSGIGLLSSGVESSMASAEVPAFAAFQVIPDASFSLDPSLVSINVRIFRVVPPATIEPWIDSNKLVPTHMQTETFLKKASSFKGGALWLGEHHNSVRDHNLQANILTELRQMRGDKAPLAIGLEQVQVQFQPVLDDYCAGRITLAQMRQGVEWDKRWSWPFEPYEPIFTVARERQISLVALNVDSEDQTLVEKGGLPGLGREKLGRYIVDGYVRL